MIDPGHHGSRSSGSASWCRSRAPRSTASRPAESEENLALMRLIDEQFLETPVVRLAADGAASAAATAGASAASASGG